MSTDLLVINGPGVVARHGSAVLWAESTDLRREGLLAAVVAGLRELGSGKVTPGDYAAWLIGELAGPRGSSVPALAFTAPDAGQVLCVVQGWGRVSAPGGAVNAAGIIHRIPSTLPIAIGRADLAVVARGDSLLDLEAGAVPGGAALLLATTPSSGPTNLAEGGARAVAPEAKTVVVLPSEPTVLSQPASPAPPGTPAASAEPLTAPPLPEPPSTATPAPEPAPTPAAAPERTPDSVVVSLHPGPDAPEQRRAPLPVARPATATETAVTGAVDAASAVSAAGAAGAAGEVSDVVPAPASPRSAIVTGVRCSRQHFNNPGALFCRVCGISTRQGPLVQVQAERPPLGVLICDDGATYALDGDYAIGSDPRGEPGVLSGLAQPLVIGDAMSGVAPTHVIIHLDQWEVLALNRSPGFPVAVLHRGDTQWTPLPPNQWARLMPGSYVGFAGRHVVFETSSI